MQRFSSVDSQRARARRVLISWLQATKIPFRIARPDEDVDLVLIGTKGELRVKMTQDLGPSVGVSDTLNIPQDSMASPKIQEATAAFHLVTARAGYGEPTPVDRGPAPIAIRSKDDFESVIMRHREFRAAPNPDESVMLQYEPAIRAAARGAYHQHRKICQSYGYEIDDLRSLGRIWTVNFLHKYAVDEPKKNFKLIYQHLRQRINNMMFTLSQKKLPNVFPDPEVAMIAFCGVGVKSVEKTLFERTEVPEIKVRCPGGVCMYFGTIEIIAQHLVQEHAWKIELALDWMEDTIEIKTGDSGWLQRNRVLDVGSKKRRQKDAAALLDRMLTELPHDRMVTTLQDAVGSTSLCPDSRRMASLKLREHQEECSLCPHGVSEEQEHVAGSHRASAPKSLQHTV